MADRNLDAGPNDDGWRMHVECDPMWAGPLLCYRALLPSHGDHHILLRSWASVSWRPRLERDLSRNFSWRTFAVLPTGAFSWEIPGQGLALESWSIAPIKSTAAMSRGSMDRLFALIRTRGPAWNPSVGLEQQAEWRLHADFMNGLAERGFVLLGGPLEQTPDVLLIIRAGDEEEIQARLAADPWTTSGLLRIKQIAPWTLRLGSLSTKGP